MRGLELHQNAVDGFSLSFDTASNTSSSDVVDGNVRREKDADLVCRFPWRDEEASRRSPTSNTLNQE